MLFQLTPIRACHLVTAILGLASFFAPAAKAQTVVMGDITKELGPTFFIDTAEIGGGDQLITQGKPGVVRCDFSTIQQLNVGKVGSKVTITGLGWASPKSLTNTPTSIDLKVLYLGKDGKGGGGDDVTIGTVTAQYSNTSSGEYYLKLDQPMSAVVDGQSPFFRVDFSPSNAAGNAQLRLKKDQDVTKITVSGTSEAVDN